MQDTRLQYTVVQDDAVQCNTVKYCAIQDTRVQYTVVQDYAVQCNTIQNSAMQNSRVQYTVVQDCATQCNTMLQSASDYNTGEPLFEDHSVNQTKVVFAEACSLIKVVFRLQLLPADNITIYSIS